jgi:translation initiation factor IF-3
MRKFNKPEPKPLINGEIKFNTLRVIEESNQLGVLSKTDALRIAESKGLDLVVITESADPPVAKILNANKYFYEQKRREKDAAKRQRESRVEVKEIQFRPGIGDHDFETKLKNIDKFLAKGNKVKLMVRFRGRENANKQIGFDILNRVFDSFNEIEWDSKPNLNGNRLIGIIKRGKNA